VDQELVRAVNGNCNYCDVAAGSTLAISLIAHRTIRSASREPFPRDTPIASVVGVTIAIPGRRISKARPSRNCTSSGSNGEVVNRFETSLAVTMKFSNTYGTDLIGSTSTM
jgi:hypothetical protein